MTGIRGILQRHEFRVMLSFPHTLTMFGPQYPILALLKEDTRLKVYHQFLPTSPASFHHPGCDPCRAEPLDALDRQYRIPRCLQRCRLPLVCFELSSSRHY
jgi:hypothetical protein